MVGHIVKPGQASWLKNQEKIAELGPADKWVSL